MPAMSRPLATGDRSEADDVRVASTHPLSLKGPVLSWPFRFLGEAALDYKDLTAFAKACHDTHDSVGALLSCLRRDNADGTVCNSDCKAWNITEREWRDAIVDALEVRIRKLIRKRIIEQE
jgi:hypothetical protein